jgi:hypothetical protein
MEREERPAHGTAQGGPSLLSDKETALYKHVKFFDRDGDGAFFATRGHSGARLTN